MKRSKLLTRGLTMLAAAAALLGQPEQPKRSLAIMTDDLGVWNISA